MAQSPGSAPLFVVRFYAADGRLPLLGWPPAVLPAAPDGLGGSLHRFLDFLSISPAVSRTSSELFSAPPDYAPFYQHSTSWPVSVTRTVISHWAEGFPSSV